MTVQLTPHVIRLACVKDVHTPANDLLTAQAPVIWRGTDVFVQLGFFIGAAIIDTKSNISKIYLELHSPRSSPPLVQKEINGSDLDVTVTEAHWTDKSQQNLTVQLTSADTQQALNDSTDDKRDFWLVVHAVDTSGKLITWGVANLTIEEDGAQNDLAVVPMASPAFRILNGELQLYNPDQPLTPWHSIYVRGTAGQEQIVYGGGVA